MSRLSRILLFVVFFVLLVAMAATVFAVITVRRPFPQTEGAITLDGLQAEVNVYRDAHGVPHIYAENRQDM